MDYREIFLLEINSQSLYSKFYSESGKMVQKLFTEIIELAQHHSDNLYFLLIDEIEGIAGSRERCISAAEPTDTVRVVNALLTHLDKIAEIANIFVLATSNLLEHIDAAFLDRVDLKITISNPSHLQIYSILREGIHELMRANIIKHELYDLQTSLLQVKHLLIDDLLNENPSSKLLLKISKQFELQKASGRGVKKALLTAFSLYSRRKRALCLDDYLLKLQAFQMSILQEGRD